MATPDKLYEEWCCCTPKNADFSDVERVALHFLGPENVRTRDGGGSHLLMVDGPLMEIVARCKDAGLSEVSGIDGRVLSIPVKNGRKVKSIYVDKLLKLIAFKNQLPKGYKL